VVSREEPSEVESVWKLVWVNPSEYRKLISIHDLDDF
jgi:hypothetical protein